MQLGVAPEEENQLLEKADTGRHWAPATIVCCALAAICEGLDLQAAGVSAAGIAGEFHAAPDQLGTFFSASTVGLLIGALVGGRISDSVGRKKVLIYSIAVFGIFSLFTPIAWDMVSLSVARLLTGLGLGGALPNLLALTNESSSVTRRRANVALVYAGNPVGGALASLLALSLRTPEWRWIFIAGGVAPLVIAPIMQVILPKSLDQASRTPSHAGPDDGASAAYGFVAITSEGRLGVTLLLWFSFFLGLLILYLLLSWLPTLLIASGLSKTQAAGAQIAFNIGGAMAALGIGQLLEGRLRAPSVILAFLGLPILIFTLAKAVQLSSILVIVFCLGCAVLAAQAFLYAEAPTRYPGRIRGVGVGAAVAAGRLGSIAGPKLGGALKGMGHSSSQLLLDLLPLVLVGSAIAIVLLFYRTTPEAGATVKINS